MVFSLGPISRNGSDSWGELNKLASNIALGRDTAGLCIGGLMESKD